MVGICQRQNILCRENICQNWLRWVCLVQVPVSELKVPVCELEVPVSELQGPVCELEVPVSELKVPECELQVPECELQVLVRRNGPKRAAKRLSTIGVRFLTPPCIVGIRGQLKIAQAFKPGLMIINENESRF